MEIAAEAAVRVRGRNAVIRNGFLESSQPDVPAPLARMMRGGQGGEAKLKLLLSLLWIAGKPPYDTTVPARSWATLAGLDDPQVNGARRMNSAVLALEAQKLVRVVRHAGLPPTVFLKDERGNGEDYTHPGAVLDARRGTPAAADTTPDERYVKLPPEFWTTGWVEVLSAPAIAMWLVLSLQAGRTGRVHTLWLSQREAVSRFGLSPDTRSAGFNELAERGLVGIGRRPVARDSFDYKKVRNVYQLYRSQLLAGPGQTPLADGDGDDVEALAPTSDEAIEADAGDAAREDGTGGSDEGSSAPAGDGVPVPF